MALSPVEADRWEPAGIPALTYRSDLGLGLGILGATTRFRSDCQPFCWRALVLLQGVFRLDPEGLVVPTRNAIVFVDVPRWTRPEWRLMVAAADYDEQEVGYSGIGTRGRFGASAPVETYRWHRRLAGFKLRQRLRGEALAKTGFTDAYVGTEFGWNQLQFTADSKLALDARADSNDDSDDAAFLSRQIGVLSDHADGLINGGIIIDRRDHEFTPQRGSIHELSARLGRAGGQGVWGNIFVESAGFWSLMPNRLVLAARGLVDHVVGPIPLYRRSEMSGLIPSQGIAGAEGVRGLPAYGEMGKTKLLFNGELRLRLLDHRLVRQRLSWRAVFFSDVGRAFTDLHDSGVGRRALDGRWWHFLWGLGAGVRLRWGEAFVLRLDGAVSPLENSKGVYFGADHLF